jgi:hypothetical protein
MGKGVNTSLDEAVLESAQLEWLGNEASCGVGMQRIDIMPSVVHNEQRVLVPIELKAVEADEKNVVQIQRYVDWIEQYYTPNRQSDIQPVLIAFVVWPVLLLLRKNRTFETQKAQTNKEYASMKRGQASGKNKAEIKIGCSVRLVGNYHAVPKGTVGRVVEIRGRLGGRFDVRIEWSLPYPPSLCSDWLSQEEYKKFVA